MRLFGNMYAGELVHADRLDGRSRCVVVVGHHVDDRHIIAGSIWSIFHILIVALQAFIFMMLTLMYRRTGDAHRFPGFSVSFPLTFTFHPQEL